MSENQKTVEHVETGPVVIASEVEASEIVARAQSYADRDFRLLQMGCTRTETEMDIIYSFETADFQLENLRMIVTEESVIPSISGVFFYAFLYENEIHDLYGVTFTDMAIDFKGNLLETAMIHPYSLTPKLRSTKREEHK